MSQRGPEGQGLAGGHEARLWQGWTKARAWKCSPQPGASAHGLPSSVSLRVHRRREERFVCLRNCTHRSLRPALRQRPQSAEAAAHGPGAPQPRPGHPPAASRSVLSTCSVRRHSRPWAPATPRSSSFLGMGSSESHCSTSQLRAKERTLRSRGAPRIPPGSPRPQPHLQPPLRAASGAFC